MGGLTFVEKDTLKEYQTYCASRISDLQPNCWDVIISVHFRFLIKVAHALNAASPRLL